MAMVADRRPAEISAQMRDQPARVVDFPAVIVSGGGIATDMEGRLPSDAPRGYGEDFSRMWRASWNDRDAYRHHRDGHRIRRGGCVMLGHARPNKICVIAGLDLAIHLAKKERERWNPGSSPRHPSGVDFGRKCMAADFLCVLSIRQCSSRKE